MQLRSDQCIFYDNNIAVLVYVDDVRLTGDEDEVKDFLKKLKKQLQLKPVTKLQIERLSFWDDTWNTKATTLLLAR
eukprot:4134612-Amphidinium_carterae.1